MVPLLRDSQLTWKKAAFSQYPRNKVHEGAMGHSIRTKQWRYTEWIDTRNGEILDRELYDHSASQLADKNLSDQLGLAKTIEELSSILDKGKGWRRIKNDLDKM